MSSYAGTIPDWLENPDVVLLRDVATAVMRLDEVEQLDSFALPYPDDAQRALDGLVLACLRGGARPPAGVPEMVHWCRTRPLRGWPLDGLPLGLFNKDNRLIDPDSGTPTQLCGELEVKGAGNSTGRQYVDLVIREAMSACRAVNSPQSYTAFRRLLVARPVLTEQEWPDISADLYLDPVQFLIEEIYAPVPASHGRDGAAVTCARCHTLLTPWSGTGGGVRTTAAGTWGFRLSAGGWPPTRWGNYVNSVAHCGSSSPVPDTPRWNWKGSCVPSVSPSRCGPASTPTT